MATGTESDDDKAATSVPSTSSAFTAIAIESLGGILTAPNSSLSSAS